MLTYAASCFAHPSKQGGSVKPCSYVDAVLYKQASKLHSAMQCRLMFKPSLREQDVCLSVIFGNWLKVSGWPAYLVASRRWMTQRHAVRLLVALAESQTAGCSRIPSLSCRNADLQLAGRRGREGDSASISCVCFSRCVDICSGQSKCLHSALLAKRIF